MSSEGNAIFAELAYQYFIYGSAALGLVAAAVGVRVALYWIKYFTESATERDEREWRDHWH